MGPLAGFERLLERLFERPGARLFGARLQPVQLQRRIERAMESERLTSGGRTHVPNRYVVRVSAADFELFGEMAQDLAAELADAALAYARQHRYTLSDRPRVTLLSDASLRLGDIHVVARFARPEGNGSDRGAGDAAGDATRGDGATALPPALPGYAVGDSGQASSSQPASNHRVSEAEPISRAGVAPEGTMVFEVPRSRAPHARLRLVTPDGRQRQIDVQGAPLTVGRATDNELVIRDGRVSRHHARLHARSGALVLTDLGSTNGTRVNGMRVEEVALGEGDRIEIGDSLLIVDTAPER